MNNTNTIEKLLLGATEEQLQSLIAAKRTIRAIEQQVRFPHVRRSQHDGDGDGHHHMAKEVRDRISASMKKRWKERKNGGKKVAAAEKG